jgi:hypothetical protein
MLKTDGSPRLNAAINVSRHSDLSQLFFAGAGVINVVLLQFVLCASGIECDRADYLTKIVG